jgi:hypothetical protein
MHSNVVTTPWSTDRDRIQPAPAQHTENCPPSGSTWMYGPCETLLRQARQKFSRFHVSTHRGSSLTYLSTPVWPPTEWGRNCKGTKWSSSHQISRDWNHRWSVRKQCGTFIRDWRRGLADRISRGNNKLAPERILWARGCIYILYKEYLAARNKGQHCYPTHRASLSNLILLNPVIKCIVHDDAWYPPENPEFDYKCLINILVNVVFSNTGPTP